MTLELASLLKISSGYNSGLVTVFNQYETFLNNYLGACPNSGNNTPITIPSGLFTAQLHWSNPYVSMTLSNPLMGESVHNCGFAAAGSGDLTLYDVYPGTYPVTMSAEGYDAIPEEMNLSDTVTLDVHAVTANSHGSFTVTNRYQYPDLGVGGHLADIVITRPRPGKPPVVEYVPTFPTGGRGGYGSRDGGSGPSVPYLIDPGNSHITPHITPPPFEYRDPPLCQPAYSCGCMPCKYAIRMYLNQASLGPISGARVRLYRADEADDANRTILYVGESTVSTDINKAGIIRLPVPSPRDPNWNEQEQAFMEKIADYDGDFILEVSGGVDIDRDDDWQVDSHFTRVNGTLHLILSKEQLLKNDYKVNILTEIAYQVSRDLIGKHYDPIRLHERLDDVARRVLVEKLYPDATEPIGRKDLMWWIPASHKNWLLKPYDSTLEPIVQKVYAGEDIAEDAYRYVYEPFGNAQGDAGVPVVRSQWFHVDENQSGPLRIGTVKVADEGNSSVTGFSLSGEGAENFRIDGEGKLYAKEGVTFDYESRPYYQLTLTARNAQGSSRPVSLYIIVDNLPDVPEDRGFSGGSVAEDAPEGTVAGQVIFDPGAAPIDRIELGGPDAASFTVDRNGTIRVSAHSHLDYERSPAAHITLQAFNALGASRVVPVTLAVTDAVDVPIVGTLDVKLPENSPAGTLVGTVSIQSNEPLLDCNLSGDGAQNFTIDRNGTVRVAPGAKLDYETRANYVLSVHARNALGSARPGLLVVRLQNRPDVPELGERNYHVYETAAVGSIVGNVPVESNGSAPVSGFELRGGGAEYFTVDAQGTIRTARSLPRHEERAYLSFDVIAANAQGKSLPARQIVYIDTRRPILGGLDTWVYENSPAGTDIGRVPVARSAEPITEYRLEGEGSEDFTIDRNGTIRVAPGAVIDYEQKTSYTLRVYARSAAGESAPGTVRIRVVDRDDTMQIRGFSTRIPEDTPVGSMLGIVSLLRTGGKHFDHYQLSGAGSEHFGIDNQGVVRLVREGLDNQKEPSYHLGVVAVSDDGSYSNTAWIDIGIDDSLRGHPILAPTTLHIAENAATGSVVGRVRVVDPGSSPIERFTLQGTGPFTIDANGTVYLNGTLDYEQKRRYHLQVIAYNRLTSSAPYELTIEVDNVPDTPPTLDNSSWSVEENASVSTALGQIPLRDPGEGNITGYSLEGSGAGDFRVDSDGTLRVAHPLDYETTREYDLRVTAQSSTGASRPARVHIAVRNVPEFVPVLYPTDLAVEENATIGTKCGSVREAPGGDSPITGYWIDDANGTFSIDENGTVYVRKALDYETKREYNLTVRARNAVGWSDPAPLHVGVLNVIDDEPVLEDARWQIQENVPVGTEVGRIEINSTGTSPITGIRLEGDGAEDFTVDANGSVRTAGSIDYETQSHYHLRAIATNAKADSPAADVTIDVVNVPELRPVLNRENIQVREDTAVGTLLGHVSLHSEGDSSIEEYAIDGSDRFDVNASGAIILRGALDYESKKEYNLTVRARNAVGWSDPVPLHVGVLNVPDGEPVLQPVSFRVEENAGINTVLGQIPAADEGDAPIEGYELFGDGNDHFRIDSGGKLYVAGVLDYERKDRYHLKVRAYNAIGPGAWVDCNVTVLDTPDTPPVVRGGIWGVDLNASVGTVVGRVHIDTQGSAITSVSLGGDGHEDFSIDRNGTIRTARSLDYQRHASYSLQVVAENTVGRSDPASVTIRILLSRTGTSGDDTLSGDDRNDALYGLEGNDTLYGQNGDDTLEGGEGNDTLYGGQGSDHLVGGAGDDVLRADDDYDGYDNGGADTLEGGPGADGLYGFSGNDVYVYARGDGRDVIYDYDRYYGNYQGYNAGEDTLRFKEGITPEDLILREDGDDLIVALKEDGVAFEELHDQIRIRNWYEPNNQIEHFEFVDANGTVYESWDSDTIASKVE